MIAFAFVINNFTNYFLNISTIFTHILMLLVSNYQHFNFHSFFNRFIILVVLLPFASICFAFVNLLAIIK